MDPALFQLAQEQMSRMSPDEIARIQQQMFSNPDLMRMASESIRNMNPEDMRVAAEHLKHTRPEDVAGISEMMANASPGDIASMRARVDAQMTYEINAAQMLKNQGNELHNQGRYEDALQKYALASTNLKGILSFKAKQLAKTCSLNLMSCYLKTRKYEECIEEGSKVLAEDRNNLKALYRRGQAYKELGKYDKAVSDLKIALESSPDDETIALLLREAEQSLARENVHNRSKGVLIEEITEESEESTSEACRDDSHNHNLSSEARIHSERQPTFSNDSNDLRSLQNYIANVNPETLAGLSREKVGEISPEMFKTATNMISNMSPETFQSVLRMSSEFHDDNRLGNSDMLKSASDMMSKMSPDELKRIFEMTSSLQSNNSANPESRKTTPDNQNGEIKTSNSSEMQERMMNQMKDPATQQKFASMMKNISPETLSSMGEQFGMKLSPEEAAKAQQAMASLSPEALEKMMLWSNRIQRGVEGARSFKNWFLGKQGMLFTICILLLAVILRLWLCR